MESPRDGCQAPEASILCIKNCGFFGSAATMNMCSKCHKDMILKQHQAKLAASSIENIISGTSNEKGPVFVNPVEIAPQASKTASPEPSSDSMLGQNSETKVKEGPNRCTSCSKRVGLTGFKCRCGDIFCSIHRYSDKHDCQFDYRAAAQGAIAKANPLVKADKLDNKC